MARTHSDRVAEHFRAGWTEYDSQIRAAIPFYDQALETLVAVARSTTPDAREVLHLGTGTGQLAELMLAAFPQAHVTGIDIVEDYLNLAAQRLAERGDRIDLIRADIAEFEMVGPYDAVVTSFACHHLPDRMKQKAYAAAFASLRPRGCMLIADFVHSGTEFYGEVFDQLRVDLLRREGWSEADIKTRYVDHRRLELPAPMELQRAWLEGIGFVDVECFWKYLNLAVFGGRKAPESSGADDFT